MKLAFNSRTAPGWDLPTLLARAAELGFDGGVELDLPNAAGPDPSAGSVVADLDAAERILSDAKTPLVGLSTPLRYTGDYIDDHAPAVRRAVELAVRLGCRQVRLLDADARRKQSPSAAATRLADWLGPLADHASAVGVTLVVQNALAFRTARPLWSAMELLDHPAVAVAWDVAAAHAAGEEPGISVPTLNTRILQAIVSDASADGSAALLGEGAVPVRALVDRLRGIGFGGAVTVGYSPADVKALGGDPAAVLAHAAEQWKKWKPPEPKAAKKPAGKPAA